MGIPLTGMNASLLTACAFDDFGDLEAELEDPFGDLLRSFEEGLMLVLVAGAATASVRRNLLPCGCIASKIWDAFFGRFGPFGAFGPFLHILCGVVSNILRHILIFLGSKRTKWAKRTKKR